MNLTWHNLTSDQQVALQQLSYGPVSLHRELSEQLRNLGLAERQSTGVVISALGRAMMPADDAVAPTGSLY